MGLELSLVSGVVHNAIMDFPHGCQRLVFSRVIRASFQVWPRNIGAYYSYNGYPIEIPDCFILEPPAKSLTLSGYNIDATHDHEISIALQVTDPEVFFAQIGLLSRLDHFINLQRIMLGLEKYPQQGGEKDA